METRIIGYSENNLFIKNAPKGLVLFVEAEKGRHQVKCLSLKAFNILNQKRPLALTSRW